MGNKFQEEIIDIKGMHCKSCVEKIESKLSQINGIEDAKVSLVEEKAFVKFDSTKVDIDAIKKEIESIGYETNVTSDESAKIAVTGVKPSKSSIKQGIVFGLVIGSAIFIATNWLVIKGGPVVGPNLSLLGQFFIGYDVTFLGSIIGFGYGFLCGFLVGYITATLYNLVIDIKENRSKNK
jgi:copper chaperone CopZ